MPVCLLIAAVASAIFAQEFEVVSVKPSKAADNSSQTNSNQGRYTASNETLRNMILMAYGIRDYQLEGPDWLRSERYDVAAKFPEALPRDREKYRAGLQAMMQQMLTARFKLATHREQKVMSVYGLVVGKNGIRFKQAPDGDSHNQNSSNNHYKATSTDMASLAAFLSRRMDQPVLDMTGLSGFFDMELNWVPEARSSVENKSDADAPSGPTLTQAIQEQLGLKLEARKAPIEILVVDRAEKAPSEN